MGQSTTENSCRNLHKVLEPGSFEHGGPKHAFMRVYIEVSLKVATWTGVAKGGVNVALNSLERLVRNDRRPWPDREHICSDSIHLHLGLFWGGHAEPHKGGNKVRSASSVLPLEHCPASMRTWKINPMCQYEEWGGVITDQGIDLKTFRINGLKLELFTVSARASSQWTACLCRTSTWQNGPERGLHWEWKTFKWSSKQILYLNMNIFGTEGHLKKK